jgi:hypothetical protein
MGLLDYFDQFTVDEANAPAPKDRTGPGMIDRKLEERSYLDFKFPLKAEGGPPLSVRLPFFENIQIVEKKRARYQKYKPVSRSSDLYAYLGSDSRKLSISFLMTYPHITSEGGGLEQYMNAMTEDSYEKVRAKFKGTAASDDPPTSQGALAATKYLLSVQEAAQQVLHSWETFLGTAEWFYFQQRYGIVSPQLQAAFDNANNAGAPISTIAGSEQFLADSTNADVVEANHNATIARKAKVIDIIIYWINIIRSSVVNNAMDPTLGPPIVRVNHGVLYQDIPCICTSYNIQADPTAPIDIDTLLPHRVKVDMELEEIRTGNFGQFRDEETMPVSRDNLAGWEAVITVGSMDPGPFPPEVTGTLD